MMTKEERRINFIVNNLRLSGLHCTPEEIKLLEKVVYKEMSTDEAVKEAIVMHEKKYGRHA